jgi:glyoxylate reductase
MPRPRILLLHRVPSSALAILKNAGDVAIADPGDGHAQWLQAAPGVDVIVSLLTDKVDASLMDAAGPSLRLIAQVAVGFDNVDVPAARARGITVTHTPGVLTESVAEFTWALIFAITRRLVEGDRLLRRGEWAGWALDFLPGMELSGKLLGIVGAGRIGRAVARRAAAFGVQPVFATRKAVSTVDGHPVKSFDELLVSSDIISLHLPLTPESRHLIDKRALARMRRSAFLVNTSRGPVVDEEALAWALGERLIAGAALDVYEREPQVHPALLPLENVVLAPHLGSATRETRTAMAELAARNVAAVLGGDPPLNRVPGS